MNETMKGVLLIGILLLSAAFSASDVIASPYLSGRVHRQGVQKRKFNIILGTKLKDSNFDSWFALNDDGSLSPFLPVAAASSYDMAVSDDPFTPDGTPKLVFYDPNKPFSVYDPKQNQYYFPLGNASLQSAIYRRTTTSKVPLDFSFGDVTGDGRTDIAISERASANYSRATGADSGTVIDYRGSTNALWNNGVLTYLPTEFGPLGISIKDVDADGVSNVVTRNANVLVRYSYTGNYAVSENVSVYFGISANPFISAEQYFPLPSTFNNFPRYGLFFDFNNDGRSELVASDGTLVTVQEILPQKSEGKRIYVDDTTVPFNVNQIGTKGFIKFIPEQLGLFVEILLVQPDFTVSSWGEEFQLPFLVEDGESYKVSYSDFDNDGDDDVAVYSSSGKTALFENTTDEPTGGFRLIGIYDMDASIKTYNQAAAVGTKVFVAGKTAITDQYGAFTLAGVAPGRHNISVQALNSTYVQDAGFVDVLADGRTSHTIVYDTLAVPPVPVNQPVPAPLQPVPQKPEGSEGIPPNAPQPAGDIRVTKIVKKTSEFVFSLNAEIPKKVLSCIKAAVRNKPTGSRLKLSLKDSTHVSVRFVRRVRGHAAYVRPGRKTSVTLSIGSTCR